MQILISALFIAMAALAQTQEPQATQGEFHPNPVTQGEFHPDADAVAPPAPGLTPQVYRVGADDLLEIAVGDLAHVGSIANKRGCPFGQPLLAVRRDAPFGLTSWRRSRP